MWTGRLNEVIVPFRNFAKTPKNVVIVSVPKFHFNKQ